MSVLHSIETYIDKEKNYYGSFVIEPLEVGQGITLGNALRRTLLSDLSSFAITGVRINNLKHEFSTLAGVREDVLEILLHLKEVVFKSCFLSKEKKQDLKVKAFLHCKGPILVTAGMFHLPKNLLKVINPSQYICTLVDTGEFYLEVDIENGTGYRLIEENRKETVEEKFRKTKPTTLLIDTLFMPIKKVNYKIKLIHDTEGNIKESLFLEIITNGSITPKRSLQEALKILMSLFYPLFFEPEVKEGITKFFDQKKIN